MRRLYRLVAKRERGSRGFDSPGSRLVDLRLTASVPGTVEQPEKEVGSIEALTSEFLLPLPFYGAI